MKNITMAGIEETENSRVKNSKPEQTQNKQNENSDDWKKNYLDVKLEKGQEKKELIIRLLPITKDSETPFKFVQMHNVKVPTEVSKSGWKSYVCLAETEGIDTEKFGNKCPYCELRHEAFKRAKDTNLDQQEIEKWREIGKENFPKETCIIRCIERGHEDEGPKFWKFTVKKDGTDPYHIIKELNEARREEKRAYGMLTDENWSLYDLYTGKDLKIVITEQKQDPGSRTKNTKTGIAVMDFGPEGPLSRNEEDIEKWVNNPKEWSDVFTVKPYEYLSIVLDGKTPFYDRGLDQWVVKKEKGEGSTKSEDQTKKEEEINSKINNTVPQTTDINNGDLPF